MTHILALRDRIQVVLSKLGGSKYSDVTIRCGDDVHFVHKAHICPQSRVFAAMCDGQFKVSHGPNPAKHFLHVVPGDTNVFSKEALDSEINLLEDDPDAMVAVLYWLYTGSYSVYTKARTRDTASLSASFTGPEEELNKLLNHLNKGYFFLVDPCFDAKVYALTEKYEILDLKVEILSELCKLGSIVVQRKEFMAATKIAYTTTLEEDRHLKDWFVRCLSSSFRQLYDEDFGTLLSEIPRLGRDVLLYMHEHDKRDDATIKVKMLD